MGRTGFESLPFTFPSFYSILRFPGLAMDPMVVLAHRGKHVGNTTLTPFFPPEFFEFNATLLEINYRAC